MLSKPIEVRSDADITLVSMLELGEPGSERSVAGIPPHAPPCEMFGRAEPSAALWPTRSFGRGSRPLSLLLELDIGATGVVLVYMCRDLLDACVSLSRPILVAVTVFGE